MREPTEPNATMEVTPNCRRAAMMDRLLMR